jgi:hypothetical protein
MSQEAVTLSLSGDEALVLYEWITRFNKRDDVSFVDQAEQRVLWDIEARLESALSQPFSGDYDALLARARDCVRDPGD